MRVRSEHVGQITPRCLYRMVYVVLHRGHGRSIWGIFARISMIWFASRILPKMFQFGQPAFKSCHEHCKCFLRLFSPPRCTSRDGCTTRFAFGTCAIRRGVRIWQWGTVITRCRGQGWHAKPARVPRSRARSSTSMASLKIWPRSCMVRTVLRGGRRLPISKNSRFNWVGRFRRNC